MRMSKLPIIILHGWGSSSAAWEVTKQLLQKAGYQVLVPDLPGFGKEPVPKKPWSVSDYVEWVLGFIQLAKLDKFVLIGHSFGGRIAIKLTAQYPQKVEKLILTGAAGIRFTSLGEKIKINAFQLACILGDLVFKVPPFILFRPLVRKILYWIAGVKDYYEARDPIIKETFKKVINEDLIDILPKIKVPTYLLWGKDDLMIPPKHAYIMAEKIPDSKLEIIEKAGHRLPYGQPEIFVEKVTEFLKE